MYEENNSVNIDVQTYTQLVLVNQKYQMIIREFFRDCDCINGTLYPSVSLTNVFRMVEPAQYEDTVEEREENPNE